MISFSLKITNNAQTTELLNAFTKAHAEAIKSSALQMRSYLKDILSVRVEGSGAKAIRSRAGEPPRMQSGYLRSGAEVTTVFNGSYAKITAGASAPYAKYLEYGTSNTAARPFLIPALSRFKEILTARIKNLKGSL